MRLAHWALALLALLIGRAAYHPVTGQPWSYAATAEVAIIAWALLLLVIAWALLLLVIAASLRAAAWEQDDQDEQESGP